jgi:hypothetical protein
MSGPAKCPTCGGRLEGVQPQRLHTRGAAPLGAQLYVAPCPRCRVSVPFAAVTANAMSSRALACLALVPRHSDFDRLGVFRFQHG